MATDIIFVAFVVFFTLNGRRIGFVKSVLGMFSVLICGALTIIIYNYLCKIGTVGYIGNLLKIYVSGNTYNWFKKAGIAEYIVNAVIAVVIYIGVRILYKFTVELADLTVPSFLNSILGGIFGAAKAIVLSLAVLAVIYSVRHTCDVSTATDVIKKSQLVKQLYENNILLKLI